MKGEKNLGVGRSRGGGGAGGAVQRARVTGWAATFEARLYVGNTVPVGFQSDSSQIPTVSPASAVRRRESVSPGNSAASKSLARAGSTLLLPLPSS